MAYITTLAGAMLLTLALAETYYVTPDSTTYIPCPEEDVPCFTLSQYVNKPSNYFASNTTLILLPGNHSLDERLFISNRAVVNVVTSIVNVTVVMCNHSAKVIFENVDFVSMNGLLLLGCMNNTVSIVKHLKIEDCSFQGEGRKGNGLNINLVTNANIARCTFSLNNGRTVTAELILDTTKRGGAIIVENSDVTISNSSFSNNSVIAYYAEGGAVYACNSTIFIHGSKFTENFVTGDFGRGGAVCAQTSSIAFISSIFTSNIGTGFGEEGGGICVYNNTVATVNNCTFSKNTLTGEYGSGGAVYADSSMFTITNSVFTNNTCIVTIAITYPDVSTKIGGLGGALSASNSNITIRRTSFTYNSVIGYNGQGGAVAADYSNITLNNNIFSDNIVSGHGGAGGAISVGSDFVELNGNPIVVNSCTFTDNAVIGNFTEGGAVLVITMSVIVLSNSNFTNNTVNGNNGTGGAMYADDSTVTLNNNAFTSNTVTGDRGGGGAVVAAYSIITINNNTFTKNTVNGDSTHGGAVLAYLRIMIINSSSFTNNTVTGDGGAIYFGSRKDIDMRSVTISHCKFASNTATGKGGALYVFRATLNSIGYLDVQDNTASTGVLFAIQSTLILSGNTTFSNNYGSLFVFSCNVKCIGNTNSINNTYFSNTQFQEGGAVTAFQSELAFTGQTNLTNNIGIHGGGISATECKLYMKGTIAIFNNTATLSGGGIYAYQSEINFEESTTIARNSAVDDGGGIHSISSMVKLNNGSRTYFIANHAKRGGGLCFELNSKLYIVKSKPECSEYNPDIDCNSSTDPDTWLRLEFTYNYANYGGALYVADDASSGVCDADHFRNESTVSSECFIQAIGLYQYHDIAMKYKQSTLNIRDTYFTDNSAMQAGGILYGGLLDRCTVSPFAEFFIKYTNTTSNALSATSYILNITSLEFQNFKSTKMVSSDAVRVCFCKDNQPDCSYHPHPKHVKKGETFTVSLVGVDQVNNTVPNTTIHSFALLKAELGEGQSVQQSNIDGSCTELSYSVLSPHNYERLFFYADGPCVSRGISLANITVTIAPCPIGFRNKSLRCECEPVLYPEYISNCSIDSESVQRKHNAWFSYVNTTEHQCYVYHKHCPFDYCLHSPTEDIVVNLNKPNGSDALCAFNRSGKLCGTCKYGLSVSLGSSQCRPCSNIWIALVTVFALAGIALVAFLLICNLTVADGTLNGPIFVANIFAANYDIFLPFEKPNFLSIFVAWLNLDFGFETCLYNGMDAYIKVWLQLAFPLYVISLVVSIIVISNHSNKFAALFIGKNPIATLATLILLSYTKLLRTIIAVLSFTVLQYSDGSHELVWLFDANVPYLTGKHIPLFIIALAIVIASIMYTFLLFSWQWLVYCPNRGPLRWVIGNTKVIAFMDAYHNPYNKDHRYWIGLLLLVRVLLYLVSALNVLGDPRINLLSTTSVIIFVFFYKLTIGYKKKIHKTWFTDVFENISLLNLTVLSGILLFMTNFDDNKYQVNVSRVSTSIAFITFLTILVYHAYISMFKKANQRHFSNILRQYADQLRRSPMLETEHALSQESEIVNVTEFDGLPEPEDTDISLEGDGDEDTETAKLYTGTVTGSKCVSFCKTNDSESLHDSIGRDSNMMVANEKWLGHEIEVPHLVSGHDPCTSDLSTVVNPKSKSDDCNETMPLLSGCV